MEAAASSELQQNRGVRTLNKVRTLLIFGSETPRVDSTSVPAGSYKGEQNKEL